MTWTCNPSKENGGSSLVTVPIKVISVKDIHGTPHITTVIDVDYVLQDGSEYNQKDMERFRENYKAAMEAARKGIAQAKKSLPSERPHRFWAIGKQLTAFLDKWDSQFVLTNYREAFQRELGLTDSYIGVILDFPKFFSESETMSGLPMGYYFELLLKARKLQSVGKLEIKKKELLQLSKLAKHPGHKKYRQALNEFVSSLES